ncbi:MAG: radical SAM protein [Firmicutes bacterium]|nr:radical SAM protein [Bacillota bacterium]
MNKIKSITEIYDIAYENETMMSIMIELTSLCNWSCEHCYVSESSKDRYTYNQLRSLFESLREKGVNEIVFIGGEIFIRNDIMKIISLAREMFFNVVLETNISLLNESIIQKLSELYVTEVSCTMFSLNEKVHNEITNTEGSLTKVLNNLNLLKKYGIFTSVKTPLMKKNKYDFRLIRQFCNENGFKFNVKPDLFPKRNGDALEELIISDESLQEMITEFDEINKHSFEEGKNLEAYPCLNTRISLFLDYKGEAFPCINYRQSIGNIYLNTLDEIWNHPKRHEIANLKYRDLEGCLKCNKIDLCVLCPGVAHMETGSIYECAIGSRKMAKSRLSHEKIF